MGWNRADLRGLERMPPEDAAQKILSEMAKGRNFGDAVTGGEGTRNALMPATMEKIYSAIKQYKEAGMRFSDFTDSIISMLDRGGRKTINPPGFQPTPLVIESPATMQGVQRRLDLDHSAFNHNWDNGNAYTGYYTWPEFDRAFQANNLKNIQKLPNKHNGQELWQWTVKYPKTDAHEAYELTWRIARDEKTGKMLNLFTTRQTKDTPPQQTKTPEGEHSRQVRQEGVTVPSSSGDSPRSILQAPAGSQGGVRESRRVVLPPDTPGNRLIDKKLGKDEKFKEKFIDRYATVETAQDENLRSRGGLHFCRDFAAFWQDICREVWMWRFRRRAHQ